MSHKILMTILMTLCALYWPWPLYWSHAWSYSMEYSSPPKRLIDSQVTGLSSWKSQNKLAYLLATVILIFFKTLLHDGLTKISYIA